MPDITTTADTPVMDRPIGYYVQPNGDMIICRYRQMADERYFLITFPLQHGGATFSEVEGVNFFRDQAAAAVALQRQIAAASPTA